MEKTDSCRCALYNFIIGQKRNAFIINRSRIEAKCRLLIILCKQALLEITYSTIKYCNIYYLHSTCHRVDPFSRTLSSAMAGSVLFKFIEM